jgi:hypothetical protein
MRTSAAAASVGTTVFFRRHVGCQGTWQFADSSSRGTVAAPCNQPGDLECGRRRSSGNLEDLKNGATIFSTANAKAFALRASAATIRANGDGPTVGSVSIASPNESRVSCSRGTLEISVEDDTKTVAEAPRIAWSWIRMPVRTAARRMTGPEDRSARKKLGRPIFAVRDSFSAAATLLCVTRWKARTRHSSNARMLI